MYKVIIAVLALLSFQVAKADEVVQSNGLIVEHAVVELHIIRNPKIVLEEAKASKKGRIETLGRAVCSGSFIDNTGDILTAGHCAADAASIEVVTYDNKTYQAVIVATSTNHDLALLHIDRRSSDYFRLAQSVTRGEKIFILGSPLAITNSLSTGIIAKLDGDVNLVDCSALPGNSGSAVYNENNELVGVLTAGYIVGMGTTHLNVSQSLDTVWFFLVRAFKGVKQ